MAEDDHRACGILLAMSTRATLLGLATLSFSLATAAVARAEKPWVDRPIALAPVSARFEAGVGFGQYAAADGQKFGTGSNLEGAVGLPFFGEIGVRTGYAFGDGGKQGARADYYARLFDHETANAGNDAWANPEIRVRGELVDLKVFAIGLESRFVVPLANNTDFSVAPGLPMVIRIPSVMRIDTGVFVPIAFTDQTQYTISIPVAVWFQVEDFFFGPMSGVRFNRVMTTTIDATGATTHGTTTSTDVPAGIGGGYTLGKMFDIKAQLYTLRINDSGWTKYIGGGLGVALTVP
jgi:hypothetical protein